ncbi:MAG: histidine phosphotransferase family protein [Minwuia sp.]|nr:histidine phosphotransferase family protein [Minwuia sp.]
MIDLNFSALLSSRICHDLVGPIGALSNGIELMELEDDPAMATDALDLLKMSANNASNRLKFLRLVFGASGGDAMPLAVSEARSAALAFYEDQRLDLDWPLADGPDPAKSRVRLLLNLIMSAAFGMVRGGTLSVHLSDTEVRLTAVHERAQLSDEVCSALLGTRQAATVEDARIIEAFHAALLAEAEGIRIQVTNSPGQFVISAA